MDPLAVILLLAGRGSEVVAASAALGIEAVDVLDDPLELARMRHERSAFPLHPEIR